VLNRDTRLPDAELAADTIDDNKVLDSTEREDKTLEAVLVTVLRGRKGIRMGTSDWGKMIQTT
jgi:hypothetical protein